MKSVVVALKAVIISNRRVLIVKRADNDDIGAGTWEFPGGKLEFGEKLEQALSREVYEETGLKVTAGQVLYAATFKTNPERQVVIITYLCYTVENSVNLSDEHSDYIWAGTSQMNLLLNKGILNDIEANNVFEKIDIDK